MKNIKNTIIAIALCLSIVTISSCKKNPVTEVPIEVPLPADQVKDASGNIYHTVTVGTQVWMVENLRTTKFRNGEAISQEISAAWGVLTTSAYANYDNQPAKAVEYGCLYNWYAVNDSRQLAPKGWHVATDAEWITLANAVGGVNNAGPRLKEEGTLHWLTPNNGTNNVGFKAIPSGLRGLTGSYAGLTISSSWWTATEGIVGEGLSRYITPNTLPLFGASYSKAFGLAVRCVKD